MVTFTLFANEPLLYLTVTVQELSLPLASFEPVNAVVTANIMNTKEKIPVNFKTFFISLIFNIPAYSLKDFELTPFFYCLVLSLWVVSPNFDRWSLLLCWVTVTYMKRLAFRSTSLSSYKYF